MSHANGHRRTDMTKLKVAFRNFANVPKNESIHRNVTQYLNKEIRLKYSVMKGIMMMVVVKTTMATTLLLLLLLI